MTHQHYKLITPETKEVKVEVEALEEDSKAEDLVEDSKAEDLVEDSKEEDSQAEDFKKEDFKVEVAYRLKNNITNIIPILQKQMLVQ